MKMAHPEMIDRAGKKWEEMFKNQPTMGQDGKLIPPPTDCHDKCSSCEFETSCPDVDYTK